jgi:hypothetical protein
MKLVLLLLLPAVVDAFEWSFSGRPEVNRMSIAGVWKLTPHAVKEFTVHPNTIRPANKELLLMLKEDGSFLQYIQEFDAEENIEDLSATWNAFRKRIGTRTGMPSLQDRLLKGTWDLVDGKLLLAADRPDISEFVDAIPPEKRASAVNSTSPGYKKDTLLVGRVQIDYETSWSSNPTESLLKENITGGYASSLGKTLINAKLTVPRGSVKVGKFFYPKKHPSFFEQPMFHPLRTGAFSLRQVLAEIKHRKEENIVECFRQTDFYNKSFLLTSHPNDRSQPKGRQRWSIKYNDFVEDISDQAKKAALEQSSRSVPIRVMQVKFFANNTFATEAGTGDNILRGKFSVIGDKRDQLWMQVTIFGFGRSVSGSVYSEGRGLSHEDATTYWGDIRNEAVELKRKEDIRPSVPISVTGTSNQTGGDVQSSRIEVKGSVILGWGLEPVPIASFIMREARDAQQTSIDAIDADDDDDEADLTELEVKGIIDEGVSEDGIDWSKEGGDAFQ